MSVELKDDIRKLSVPERLEFLEDIWESLRETPEVIPVTDAQKAELDRRLALHQQNRDMGASWEVVRHRLGKRR